MAPRVPFVSVVIPTRGRPSLLSRALESAFRQSLAEIEVIVVVDGPDPDTVDLLNAQTDPRLKTVTLPASVGGAGARNAGVLRATSSWIAFLDDDDEWIPEKLERQLAIGDRADCNLPIVACRTIARTPRGDYVWPRRLLREDEDLGEYLFCRHSLFQGEGLIQSSMLLAPRKLLLEHPFRPISRHQEWDWLLHVRALPGVKILFETTPCCIWHVEQPRASISNKGAWRHSFDWIREVRALTTPRAYSSFLLLLVSSLAARDHDYKAFSILLLEAFQKGSPTLLDLGLYLGMWTIPQESRRILRALISRVRR